MARTLTKEEIIELPAEERLNLMDRLWESLTPEDIPLAECLHVQGSENQGLSSTAPSTASGAVTL
ncbi:MAG: addiction module protein [Acidobacteriota bacterium]